MRIDGTIVDYVTLERSVHQPLIARIKIMANLDIAERRLPQDGHFRIRAGQEGHVNIRVSLLPTVFGERRCCAFLRRPVMSIMRSISAWTTTATPGSCPC